MCKYNQGISTVKSTQNIYIYIYIQKCVNTFDTLSMHNIYGATHEK